MKRYVFSSLLAVAALALSFSVNAQEKDKVKEKSKVGEYDEIIIRKKGDKGGRVVIELKDDQVLVDGKPLDEYEDDNISIRKRAPLRYSLATPSPFRTGTWNEDMDDHAFLGVVTDEAEGGAKINSVTENSGAAKAGLKKGDVITKVNGEDIDDPEDLTRAIRSHKPDEKVTITYKRDGKENKTTATLGNRATRVYGMTAPRVPDFNFDFDHDFGGELGRVFAYGGRARLGIKAQDTEDGKGVQILEIKEGSPAEKAGLKKDDIITEFNGESVNSAEELADAAHDAEDKNLYKVKINRNGNSQTIEVKIPKKLKTANL